MRLKKTPTKILELRGSKSKVSARKNEMKPDISDKMRDAFEDIEISRLENGNS